MGVLDYLRKGTLVPAPETINSDWASPAFSLDDRQGSFSLYVKYENGVTPSLKVRLQMSPTNEAGSWADVDDSEQEHTDDSGMAYFDVNGSGTEWVRIFIEVVSGSVDLTEGLFSAQKAHQ